MTELNFVATRNRLTGVVDIHTPSHIFEHPVLGANLELVDEKTKPLAAELINTDRVLFSDLDEDKGTDEGRANPDPEPLDDEGDDLDLDRRLDDFDPPIDDEDGEND